MQFWSRSEVHGKLIATCRPDFTNIYITATRAVVGGVFRFWKYRHNVWYRAWNCGTRLQTFWYMQEFWSRCEVHGKLIATYRHDFTNKYITATRSLVDGVFRFWKYRHHVWYRAWNCGTNLQTFGYMHKFWSRWEVHGILIATYRHDHRLRGSGSTVVTMTSKVNGKTEILTPCRSETPENIEAKLGVIDYVMDPYNLAKFCGNRSNGVCSPILASHIAQTERRQLQCPHWRLHV